MKIKYTAHATASKGGRGRGHAETDDGKVSVNFSTPKAMGGDDGPGTNPEQLFAVGYSACFLGAMHVAGGAEEDAARRGHGHRRRQLCRPRGQCRLHDRRETDGQGAGLDKAGSRLMKRAHDICPISNLIRFAHEVELVAG